MNKDVILTKLENIKNCLEQIESKKTFSELDLTQNLVKAVGLRNILVHDYTGINWTIVNSVVLDRIYVFREFSAEILKLI